MPISTSSEISKQIILASSSSVETGSGDMDSLLSLGTYRESFYFKLPEKGLQKILADGDPSRSHN